MTACFGGRQLVYTDLKKLKQLFALVSALYLLTSSRRVEMMEVQVPLQGFTTTSGTR